MNNIQQTSYQSPYLHEKKNRIKKQKPYAP